MNNVTSFARSVLFLSAGWVAAALFAGCAAGGSSQTQKPAATGQRDGAANASPSLPVAESGPPLESVKPALRHLEDSLVLDLILGYRQRAEGRTDMDVEHRARGALHQLEYMLRHGGVKERGGEARPVTPTEGVRISLRDAIEQVSEAVLHDVPGTAWQPEAERAREVQRQRPALSELVEDADWVLSLATALESSLPQEDKRCLRELHEAYAARAPHADVTARAQVLLASIQDDRLRREIKKLANRSWERERRAKSDQKADSVLRVRPSLPSAPSSPPPSITPDALDHAFDAAGNASDGKRDTLTSPERYCAIRRAEAAQAFAASRGATNDSTKVRFLRQSLEHLDDCLNRHPESPEAEKARQNRVRVEQELKP